MTVCSFCGRDNDAASRFCIDCGKPMTASAAQVGARSGAAATGAEASHAAAQGVAGAAAATAAPRAVIAPPTMAAAGPAGRKSSPPRPNPLPTRCPCCAKPADSSLPYCGHCGSRLALEPDGPPTQGLVAARKDVQPQLAVLDEEGQVARTFTIERGAAILGRGDTDIRFENDPYMSPLHCRLEQRAGHLLIRDLGSRNGTWMFIEEPTRLTDGDLVLVGSQVLRFRRLGYPGPHPPEADSTRRLGSVVPAADVAVIEQLRADGSVRDTLHLSPGRSVVLGRETGDWLFPYDQTMSGKHAEVRSEDSEYYIHDAGSRNGVAMAVHGERALRRGQRILIGNEVLRVENA